MTSLFFFACSIPPFFFFSRFQFQISTRLSPAMGQAEHPPCFVLFLGTIPLSASGPGRTCHSPLACREQVSARQKMLKPASKKFPNGQHLYPRLSDYKRSRKIGDEAPFCFFRGVSNGPVLISPGWFFKTFFRRTISSDEPLPFFSEDLSDFCSFAPLRDELVPSWFRLRL